jgi:hypothetical protein
MHFLTRTRLVVFTSLAIAVLAIAGVGDAAIPSGNGTISACKDNKGAVKVIDTEAGQSCPANQQLLNWNQQGPAGPQGAPGTPGVSGVQLVTTTQPSNATQNSFKQLIVYCPAGKQVIGGGFEVGEHFDVLMSRPLTSPSPGWILTARRAQPDAVVYQLTVYAICAVAS